MGKVATMVGADNGADNGADVEMLMTMIPANKRFGKVLQDCGMLLRDIYYCLWL